MMHDFSFLQKLERLFQEKKTLSLEEITEKMVLSRAFVETLLRHLEAQGKIRQSTIQNAKALPFCFACPKKKSCLVRSQISYTWLTKASRSILPQESS